MKKFDGETIDVDLLSKLTWIEDLIYYDGPVLSLHRDSDNHPFIVSWVDVDDMGNIWAIYETTDDLVTQLLARKTPLMDIIKQSTNIVLCASNATGNHYVKVTMDSFPVAYLPDADAFL